MFKYNGKSMAGCSVPNKGHKMQQFQAYVSYECKYNKISTQMKHKISIKVNWDCKKEN